MRVRERFARPGDLPTSQPSRLIPPPRASVPIRCPAATTIAIAEHLGWDDSRRRHPPFGVAAPSSALIYASAFIISGFFPSLLLHDSQVHLAASPLHWAPGAVAVVVALAVAVLIHFGRIPITAIATTGLLFEVVGSYGIVAAEFANPIRVSSPGFTGFSWVAVWTLLFAMVVPARPRRAAVAALASVSSVPVGMAVLTVAGVPTAASTVGPVEFFFSNVFAYVLVVVMATSARALFTVWVPKSAAHAGWEATDGSNVWARAGWARSGGPSIVC